VSSPLGVALLDRLIIEAKVVYDDFFDALRVGSLQSQVEKTALLRQEPFTELLVPAISKTADEM